MDKELLKELLEKIRTAGCYQAMVISGFLFFGGGVFLPAKENCYNVILIVFGMLLIIVAFVLWFLFNQKHIDNMLKFMAKEKELAVLENQTKKEKEAQKKEKSSDESDLRNLQVRPNEFLKETDILEFIYSNIMKYNECNFDVQREVKLRSRNRYIYFDIVVENRNHTKAFIIDIRSGKPSPQIYETLCSKLFLYKENRIRNSNLIVVYPRENINSIDYTYFETSDRYGISKIEIPRKIIEENDQSKPIFHFK